MPDTILRIIELSLQIVLKAMEGQTDEQRRAMWQWWVEDVAKWRALFAKIKDS